MSINLSIDGEFREIRMSSDYIPSQPPTSLSKTQSVQAYLILLWLGIGNMVPWNAFITAKSYYDSRLCGSSYSSTFENFFTLSYSIAQPLGIILSIFGGQFVSNQNQVRIPVVIYAVLFTIITITTGTPMSGTAIFWMTLLFTFICGLSSALMNSGLYALTGLLPTEYTSAVMLGSSMSGLVVSLSSLITQATSINPSNIDCNSKTTIDDDGTICDSYSVVYSDLVYFLIASIVIYTCGVLFEVFIRTEFLRHYMKELLRAFDFDNSDIVLVSAPKDPNPVKETVLNSRASLLALSFHSRPSLLQAVKNKNYAPDDSVSSSRNSRPLSWNSLNDSDISLNTSMTKPSISLFASNTNSNYMETSQLQPLLSDDHLLASSSIQISSDKRGGHLHQTSDTHSEGMTSILLGNSSHTININPYSMADKNEKKIEANINNNASLHFSMIQEKSSYTQTLSAPSMSISLRDIISVLYEIRIPAFTVFINFVISISVFPSVIVFIEPQYQCPQSNTRKALNELWVPTIFVIWNIFDFTGRYSAELTKPYRLISPKNIWIPAISRILLLVLLLFCNIKDSRLPHLFISDAIPLCLITIFAWSNGYIANLSMMLGPELVSLDKSSLAGTLMVMSLTTGLVGGSIVSFLLVYIVRGNIF